MEDALTARRLVHSWFLRSLLAPALVVALVATGLIALGTTPARADATGDTCGARADVTGICRHVSVTGQGTRVNKVCANAGNIYPDNGSVIHKGQLRIWGDGFYYEGPTRQLNLGTGMTKCWDINRNLKSGSYVCASWRDLAPKPYTFSPACVKIHS
jgi:hypothetical protein